MKWLNLQRLAGLILAFSLVAHYGYAQQERQNQSEKSQKKIIIIEKTVDENGEVKTEKIIRNGDELQEFHFDEKDGKIIIEQIGEGDGQQIKVIVDSEGEMDEIEQNVEVTVEEVNGEKHLRVNVQPTDGDVRTFEWKGVGDIPEEVRQQLEDEGVFLHQMDDAEDGENKVFLLKSGPDGGDFEWTSVGADGPFLGVVSAQKEEITVINEDGEETITTGGDEQMDGVLIDEVVEGSAAAEAGLQRGDILKSINGQPLESFDDLIRFMEDAEVGQNVSISYERDGQQQTATATLTERKGAIPQTLRIEKNIDGDNLMDTDDNVFIFRSGDNEEVTIRKQQKIVVITRGDEEQKDSRRMTPSLETLPDADLQRDLDLRDFKLFPNPTDGNLRLRFRGEAAPTVVRITDLNGKRLYRERLNRFDGQYDQEIDLTDLPAGVLLLTIEQGKKVYTEQLILK